MTLSEFVAPFALPAVDITAADDQPAASTDTVEPVLLLEVDITRPIPCVLFIDLMTRQRYTHGLLLVRLSGTPIGLLDLRTTDFQIDSLRLAALIWARLSSAINAALIEEGLSPVTSLSALGLTLPAPPHSAEMRAQIKAGAPLISVIVCTRDRPESLALCLQSLRQLDYPAGYEIIVVDNAPSSDQTERLIRDCFEDVIYIREERPGLSYARNRGLALAAGEIVAFTDDDAIVDSGWLIELARGFQTDEKVACVTGLTLPTELDTPAQVWFQQQRDLNSQGRGFARQRFDFSQRRDPLYPLRVSMIGAGMNMAFRAEVLRAIGGFDPALGIGSVTHGGEDMAAYFEVITRGYQIAYEPGAIVYHAHRRTFEDLRKSLYGRSVGFAAYLTRSVMRRPRLLPGLIRVLPRVARSLLAPRTRLHPARPDQRRLHQQMVSAELHGLIYGPIAYILSRWTLRRAVFSQLPAQNG